MPGIAQDNANGPDTAQQMQQPSQADDARSEALDISEGTAKTHIRHIYEKCGVANRRELVALLGA